MIRAVGWTSVAMVAVLLGDTARAQTTTRVSVSTLGTQATSDCWLSAISADGRFVVFYGAATDLVPGDTNNASDVFLRDLFLGTTERVSVAANGAQADSISGGALISADNRFVGFSSAATNLVVGDTNHAYDAFVRDLQLATTERASVGVGGAVGDGQSYFSGISADGRFVLFVSTATNMVAIDTNGVQDLFVRDRTNGTTERVSLSSSGAQGNGDSGAGQISADGRFVCFSSEASNLVPGDLNGVRDVFVRDRLNGTTALVSVGLAGPALEASTAFSISADGRFVGFESLDPSLVPNDSNASIDCFVHDRPTGQTTPVSVSSTGAVGELRSFSSQVWGNGLFATFWSSSTNLVSGDTNSTSDVFLRNLQLGTTERVSVDSNGGQSNGGSYFASLSADGRFVAFSSLASNLVAGDTNGVYDVFVRDRGAPAGAPLCFGDGGAGLCPCANSGLILRGCNNSASTGGAVLAAAGSASLASDTLVLTSSGELPSAPTIFLQGSVSIAPLNFGDGRRCTGGSLKRLYVHSASGGVVSAPQTGDSSVSARSAALGDVLSAGATRYHQAYYRDPSTSFCPAPTGNLWNISSGLVVTWTQ